MAKEQGTKESPWKLKTPPLTSEYEMYKDEKDGKRLLYVLLARQLYFMTTAV
jgi:hypothetical protein